jgi:acyl-CoA reductase-like NAD-dependent aldehyde dehydrogenase
MTDQGTLAIPEATGGVTPTSLADCDTAVAELRAHVAAWVALDVPGRIALLQELRASTWAVAEEWATLGADATSIPATSPLRGWDWLAGPSATLRNLRLLERTLGQIEETGAPELDLDTRPGGQVTAHAFPLNAMDSVVYAQFTAEVRFQPGVTEAQVRERAGRIYREGGKDDGGVTLVLGAGNVSSIPAMDVLYELFAKDRVCLLKMNPVNEHLGPVITRALGPLVDAGFLRVVYGGGDVGKHLSSHDGVDAIHITGSDKTHDAIVFGAGEEGRERKARGERVNDKPISSELGNVSPVIIVPGPWSASDIAFQGDNLASMLVQNAGFNCIASRLYVTHGSWARRRDLLDAVRDSLGRAEQRVPYYPGAVDRWNQFVEAHPQAEWFGETGDDKVPFTLIPDVPETEQDALAFTTEAFNGVVAETPLDAPLSVPAYIEKAVKFCNEQVWGTLAATIIVHPRSLKDPATLAAVEKAIEDLEYGSVVVNHWSAVPYAMASTPWGAYPGHTDQDIQSGRGVVHNTMLLEDVQKTVVRGPFRPPLTPVWFHTHRRFHEVAPRAAELEATEDLSIIPSLLWHAVRG